MVTPYYAPHVGGVETHVQAIAEGLVGVGVDVEILTQGRTRSVRRDSDKLTVRTFRTVVPSDAYPVAPALWAYLYRARRDYDVVHAHGYHGAAALGAAAATGLPVVFTPHFHGGGHTAFARILHRAYGRLGARLFRRADRIICVSRAEAALVTAHHPGTQAKLRVIPNGVDLAGLRGAEPYPTTRPVILSVGRLAPYKHVEVALDATEHHTTDCELVIIGTGPELPRLERAARSSSRVRVLGPVSDEERLRWQRSADIVVSLSEHEAFGLTLLEGLTVGARAVVTDIAAHREVAELAGAGDAVAFVPCPPNSEQVAGALRRVLAFPDRRPPPEVPWTWGRAAAAAREVYDEVAGR
jgi:glycosyltransferase involved in cell wall biosynthesis